MRKERKKRAEEEQKEKVGIHLTELKKILVEILRLNKSTGKKWQEVPRIFETILWYDLR
ncbi:hypothetical protein AGMMS50233_10580 [Endomicrobiia bacterium]|nr:hypothetical protein AGMMS50233_10580 [Endomicrobiia bacterium]